jgi:predicted DNA binding CopG/RHH family protein
MSIKEQEYSNSVRRMRTSPGLQSKIWDASDIYKEVMPDEDDSYEFLCRRYKDTVVESNGLMRFISGCVRHGAIFCMPNDPLELPDSDDDDDDDDVEKCYEKQQKNARKVDSFKVSVIRALSDMNKARMRLAEALVKRCSSDAKLIDDFAEYSQGHHHALKEDHILIELYRCLRHIHSGNYTVRYLDEDSIRKEIIQFEALFCMGTTCVAEYIANANACILGHIDMFDQAITNHNKSEKWKPMTFMWANTDEVIAVR